MHESAMMTGKAFFAEYGQKAKTVLDVGAFNINGTLRDALPQGLEYYGVDLTEGQGVDYVLDDTGILPFSDESFDLVVSTSCLEHDPCYWLTFAEMVRVAKQFVYISVPAAWPFHQHPVDCWRFQPDAGLALAKWAKRLGLDITLAESFVLGPQDRQDFVAVFSKIGLTLPRLAQQFPELMELRTEGEK